MNRKRLLNTLVACGIFGLVSQSSIEAQAKRAMTVDDRLDMVRVDDVLMTPDGSRVFYTERRLNWETNKNEKTLFAISSRGGEAVPFVRKEGGESYRISPDGKFLSLLREVEEKPPDLPDVSGGR